MHQFHRSFLFAALGLITSLFIPFQSAQAKETGFEIGHDLKAVTLEGRLEVRCMGTGWPNSAVYHCEEDSLLPAESSRFVTDRPVEADQVTLVATHEDGSTREKASTFYGQDGRSKKSFNLWIKTLFQRPLLEGGRNDIAYTLEKNGRVVKSGHFTATVAAGGRLLCPDRSITSVEMDDCRNPLFVCARYFRELNYCR